jgi:vacuolar-type H+-ATPase subunit H
MGLFSRKEERALEVGTLEELRDRLYEQDRRIEEARSRKREISAQIDQRLEEERRQHLAANGPGQVVGIGE